MVTITGQLITKSSDPFHNHMDTQIVLALSEGVTVVFTTKEYPLPPYSHYTVNPYEVHYVKLQPEAKAYTLFVKDELR